MADISGGLGKSFEKVTEKVTQGSTPGVEGIASQPASGAEIAQFQQALNSNNLQQYPGQLGSGLSAVGGASGGSGGSIGDSILKGLQQISNSRQSKMSEIASISNTKDGGMMGIQDMMKLQYNVMQMSIEQDVVGKIAASASQGIQTLFRNQ